MLSDISEKLTIGEPYYEKLKSLQTYPDSLNGCIILCRIYVFAD